MAEAEEIIQALEKHLEEVRKDIQRMDAEASALILALLRKAEGRAA